MNNFNPLVSIGIPYYKAENYILQTLESVKHQTYDNIELVLVNDCSPDNCKSIVDDWLEKNKVYFSNVIHIANEENKGLAYTCKILEKVTQGMFFCKLDADDLILPRKIEDQVRYLLNNPDVAMVYSNVYLIDAEGLLIEGDYFEAQKFSTVIDKRGPSGFIFKQLLIEDFIPNPSVLIRKCVLEKVGGYDPQLFNEDWDLWLRIAKDYKIHFLSYINSKYRIHPQSMMRQKQSLVKVYASSIVALLKHSKQSIEVDNIIAKHIYTYSIGMYRYGIINKQYLKVNFLMNRSLKALIYYVLGLSNIKINQKL